MWSLNMDADLKTKSGSQKRCLPHDNAEGKLHKRSTETYSDNEMILYVQARHEVNFQQGILRRCR